MNKVPVEQSKSAERVGDEIVEENSSTQEEIVVSDPPVESISSLPEEILEKVFSHLNAPKDIHAVSNTNGQFNRILEPSKPVWAFESIFQKIFSKLGHKDILNCRLVCKTWCQVVDHDLQSRAHTRPDSLYPDEVAQQTQARNRPSYAPRFQTCLISKGFFMDLKLGSSLEIRNFLEKMGNHPRNPLVLRSVYLENSEMTGDYWTMALPFLERFGKEVWHIYITTGSTWDAIFGMLLPEDPAWMCSCDMLVRMLAHLPNLRYLEISGIFEGEVSRPIPLLPHLHTLRTLYNEDDNISNRQFVDELLSICSSQVQLLPLFDLPVWNRHRNHFSNLPQIKHIELVLETRLQNWRQFCTQLVAPNLKKLTLLNKKKWITSNLLRPLSRNFPSLEYLKIRFVCEPRHLRSVGPPPFVLENVKTLEIVDNPDGEVPYSQLFQHLPAVEYLLVCHQQATGRPHVSFDDSTQWKLFEWLNGPSIENSDIWTKLPYLKELTLARLGDNGIFGDNENEILARKTFTREMYMSFQNEK